MITYLCRHCRHALEVDNDLAGKAAACPHCRQVSPVPLRSTLGDVPIARPAGGRFAAPVPLAPADDDRAAARGMPPDSGAEQTVRTVHPVMFRARPLSGALLIALALAGVAGIGWGLTRRVDWITALGGVTAVVAGIWFAWWKIEVSTTTLIITNKRTTLQRGFIRRHTQEILHDKVQDLQVTQSLPQRMLGIGTLGISNAGESGVEIVVEDLPNPKRIREVIDSYREIG